MVPCKIFLLSNLLRMFSMRPKLDRRRIDSSFLESRKIMICLSMKSKYLHFLASGKLMVLKVKSKIYKLSSALISDKNISALL